MCHKLSKHENFSSWGEKRMIIKLPGEDSLCLISPLDCEQPEGEECLTHLCHLHLLQDQGYGRCPPNHLLNE